MLKIRLMRIGAKKRPFYRVVAVDERSKRTGGYIELLGTYDPMTEPHEVKLKQDRIDYWVKQGAQMSDGFLRVIGKAPQRPPRKPKKQGGQGTVDSEQKTPESEKAAEVQTQEQQAPAPSAKPAPTEAPVTEEPSPQPEAAPEPEKESK